MDFHSADEVRILAIDPGTNSCGYSIIDWNMRKKKGMVLAAGTLTATDALAKIRIVNNRDTTVNKLQGYSELFDDLYWLYRPTVVVSETPYMGKFAQTFKVLSALLQELKSRLYRYNPYTDFIEIDPARVKKIMGVPGNSGDKDLMKEALRKKDELSYSEDIDFDKLDEHSRDSICVGLWCIGNFFS